MGAEESLRDIPAFDEMFMYTLSAVAASSEVQNHPVGRCSSRPVEHSDLSISTCSHHAWSGISILRYIIAAVWGAVKQPNLDGRSTNEPSEIYLTPILTQTRLR